MAQDRDQQGCKPQGEDPALPEITRFSQGGEADSDEDDDQQFAGSGDTGLNNRRELSMVSTNHGRLGRRHQPAVRFRLTLSGLALLASHSTVDASRRHGFDHYTPITLGP